MTDKQKQRMEELAENHAVENRGYAFYNTYTEKYVAEHMKPIFKAGYEAALAEPCGGCEELALLLTEELEVQEGVMEPIQVARIKQALKQVEEMEKND